MQVLITGASGFLGQRLVQRALSKGYNVCAQLRPISRNPFSEHPHLSIRRADLRDRGAISELLKGIDCVLHAAAVKSGDLSSQFLGTVCGTENLLSGMGEAGIERLHLISSFAVYDYCTLASGEKLDENSPMDTPFSTRDEYAKTKMVQESIVRDFHKSNGQKVTFYRPGIIIGKDNLWISKLGLEVGNGKWIIVGPRQKVPLIDVESCAEAVINGLGTSGVEGETFNLVDDQLPSVYTYYREMKSHQTGVRSIVLPWRMMQLGSMLLNGVNNRWAGGKMKVPSFFLKGGFAARSKPLEYCNAKARSGLNWTPSSAWRSVVKEGQ